jgi:5-methylcytosine-specific restriction enzyme B
MSRATADSIREYVNITYIEPARRSRKSEVAVVSLDVHQDMGLDNRMPAVCSALDAKKFQQRYRVALKDRSGPRQSSTATWRFVVQA